MILQSKKKMNVMATMIAILVIPGGIVCASMGDSLPQDVNSGIQRDKFLLLDSRIVERTKNARLSVGNVQKDKRNPLFIEDKPWEPRFDNVYVNVIYDEQDKLYKCWYSPFIIDERTSETPPEKRNPESQNYMKARPNHREMGVCYAVSRDGIRWEKPELGLVEFNGSKKNNLLVRGEDMRGMFYGPHGAGVFKDMRESDLARRYKMFARAERMAVVFSPDGVHWDAPVPCPKIQAPGDTHNNAFWDSASGKYIGITRLKSDVRLVGRTESSDFVNWTKAKVVLQGVSPQLQTHDMVVFPAGDVYIGLLGIMEFPRKDSNYHVKQHVELAWSPDTVTWHRIQEGVPFIGHSPGADEAYGKMPYDWGTIFASAPIFLDDEVRIYYGACDWYFFDWRIGYLALARLRPDGWAGYEQEAANEPAVVTTVPVACGRSMLRICADVGKKGSVKVALLGKDNGILAQSRIIKKTVTDGDVKWLDKFSLKNLRGKDVRLKFELKNAKLYSFNFNAPEPPAVPIADSKEHVQKIVDEILAKQRIAQEAHKQKKLAEQARRSQSPEEQVPGYIAQLKDANASARSEAADELAKIALRVTNEKVLLDAIVPLAKAMSDDDTDVRDESAEALGVIASRIKDEAAARSAVVALVKGLGDAEAEVREECAEALGRIASKAKDKTVLAPAVKPLIKALQDERQATGDFAARALREIGTSEVKENMVAVKGNDSMKRDKFLLLDDRIVERTKNARLTVGNVQKDKRNPLFIEDKPWEPRFDNLYANVLYDKKEGLYKCWYSPFIIDESTTNTPVKDQVNGGKFRYMGKHTGRRREMGICYAVSRDGIRWEKPRIGIIEFQGSKENNLVWRGPHGTGVFKDPHDPNPKRRYKMFFKGKLISVAFSGDGLHWGKAIECPEANVRGDTHNNAFYAPTLGEYVGITRTWARPRGRQVARTSSKDFLKWSKAEVVLEGLEDHLQTYAMPVFYYAGVYIGLPAIYDSKADRTHTELAWSPDTVTWHRVDAGSPLIANSPRKGEYDWGCVYPAAYPVFLKDEIRLYYGGSDDKHFGWRNGSFCLATLRPDGFAGYEQNSKDASAFVTTKPLLATGRQLTLSADVQEGGFIKTRILNDIGEGLAEAKPVRQTVTEARVQWESKVKIMTYKSKMIRLRFELKNAKLYSFSFLP